MRGNGVEVEGAKAFKTEAYDDMGAYDLLPRELRDLLKSAPVCIAAEPILGGLPYRSVASLRASFFNVLRKIVPDWPGPEELRPIDVRERKKFEGRRARK